jgi:two-component system chemotaxis response regulator CheB
LISASKAINMAKRDIHVIGASAGGIDALKRVVSKLPEDMCSALFVVLHTSPESPGLLHSVLQHVAKLPIVPAEDGLPIETGRVYVARPDRHLLIEQGRMRLSHGPKENRHRPAVDVLFRSAAWIYGPRTVGVVLSGMMEDGTAGLWAIKSCGGMAIVQDPADADYPGMPANAQANVDVDHCLPADQIGELLAKTCRQSAPAAQKHSKQTDLIGVETEYSMMQRDLNDIGKLGTPSGFSCPSCHGPLWEIKDGNLVRYRCHVGHAFGPESLVAEQSDAIEAALFGALRLIEEKAAATRKMRPATVTTNPTRNAESEQSVQQLEGWAQVLRNLLAT